MTKRPMPMRPSLKTYAKNWLIAVDSLSIHTKTHQERSSLELESIHCLGDSSECSPQHHACGKPSKAAHKKAHCT